VQWGGMERLRDPLPLPRQDYIAWPSKDGKQQRPGAGQGSGPRAAPQPRGRRDTPRPWGAFHRRRVSSTQPGQSKTIRSTMERSDLRGVWGRVAPR